MEKLELVSQVTVLTTSNFSVLPVPLPLNVWRAFRLETSTDCILVGVADTSGFDGILVVCVLEGVCVMVGTGTLVGVGKALVGVGKAIEVGLVAGRVVPPPQALRIRKETIKSKNELAGFVRTKRPFYSRTGV